MIDEQAGILLVEDDRVDVMTVQRALKKHAILNPLYVARTGTEALAMLRGEGASKIDPPPALILLDLNLPQMSGIQFLDRLRADPLLRDLPVIVVTSSNESGDRAAAFRYEVDDYLVKPHSFDEFATAIHTVLSDILGLGDD
ncbi:MAG: response regulator [Sphingobacteriia bacterium]|nr:response regulator [Sphingobacteriia bacterium]NCC39621.1 response regulator [Gammaproteobacteria bacterium]